MKKWKKSISKKERQDNYKLPDHLTVSDIMLNTLYMFILQNNPMKGQTL